MNATQRTASGDDPTPDDVELSKKQQEILAYLREQVDTRTYFKSRLIGRGIDLSAKEVGCNLSRLAEKDVDLEIEPWGASSAMTWKITR